MTFQFFSTRYFSNVNRFYFLCMHIQSNGCTRSQLLHTRARVESLKCHWAETKNAIFPAAHNSNLQFSGDGGSQRGALERTSWLHSPLAGVDFKNSARAADCRIIATPPRATALVVAGAYWNGISTPLAHLAEAWHENNTSQRKRKRWWVLRARPRRTLWISFCIIKFC